MHAGGDAILLGSGQPSPRTVPLRVDRRCLPDIAFPFVGDVDVTIGAEGLEVSLRLPPHVDIGHREWDYGDEVSPHHREQRRHSFPTGLPQSPP
jgi:hypothetical protein